MRMLPILFALLSLPAVAAAHISDMPLLQHALEPSAGPQGAAQGCAA